MNILSLFDGISCWRVALERAGIKVDKYFASEIDKYAIQIAKKNYPDTIHLWSVTALSTSNDCEQSETWHQWWNWEWSIDMIIWGSPCQDLSIAKKGWKGLQGEKSWLFFEYVRLLKEVKPKYFLLENVASMKKADKEEITRILIEIYPDTQCYLINSALVSAQHRRRLYWSNIQWVEQPTDKWIVLKDILEETVDEKYYVKSERVKTILSNIRSRIVTNNDKSPTILSNEYKQSTDSIVLIENINCFYELNSVWKLRQWYEYFKVWWKTYSINCAHAQNTMIRIWQLNSKYQGDRVYSYEWKSISLSAIGGNHGGTTGLYDVWWVALRNRGEWKRPEFNNMAKANSMTTVQTDSMVSVSWVIRRLTPIECEKLQTLPVNYTEGVSNSQRYKAIWNGWTVDVIAHIFSYI